MLDEIKQYLGIQKHQRAENPIVWRNGYYYRSLDTELGLLTNIKAPRCRRELFKTNTFQRYQENQHTVNEAICNVFLGGVSAKDVLGALKATFRNNLLCILCVFCHKKPGYQGKRIP